MTPLLWNVAFPDFKRVVHDAAVADKTASASALTTALVDEGARRLCSRSRRTAAR
jgi:hypothetical protein